MPGSTILAAWNYNTGERYSWVWAFVIADDATDKVVFYGEAGPHEASKADVAAESAVQNYSAQFTLAARATLDFMVRDYYLPDNDGGVAVKITSATATPGVPEPSGAALFLVGLFGLPGSQGAGQPADASQNGAPFPMPTGEKDMHMRFIPVMLLAFAATAFAAPAPIDDSGPIYVLFVNTSSHAFRVTGMTLGGKACPACADRTVAPGTVTMVKLGDPGGKHLKLVIKGGGTDTCHYDIAADGNSENGDCGSTPKIDYRARVHSDFMFDTKGTPSFDLFYAYDPPKRK